MPWVILPDWTPFNVVIHAAVAIWTVAMVPMTRLGLVTMNYSKFRLGTGMPARAGMFILYFLPLLVLFPFSWSYLDRATLVQWCLFLAVGGHFSKRCLEVLFVHRYSGPIDVATVAQITFNYAALTALASWFHQRTVASPDALFWLGAALFVAGELVNLWHHLLLARLRSGGGEYVIPRGGLFSRVTVPHYLGELVAWLGVALMSRHLIVYLMFLTMVVYLADRARATHDWYLERFPDYPRERARILPWVY